PARAPSFAAARLRLAQPTSALSYAAAKLVRHSLLAKPDDVAIISYSMVKQPRGICVRIPAAGSARGLLDGAPQRIEGAGKAGCSSHPQPRAQTKKRTSVVTTGSPKQSDLPCAMVYGLNGLWGKSVEARRAGWSRRRNPPSGRFITADHDPPYELIKT